jgi:hypothetical protein
MSYYTLHKLKERKNNIIPDSLNDPYNSFSYKINTFENFIPLNYGGTRRVPGGTKQADQQAIQQQIIQIHKKQELMEEEKENLDTLKKLNILKTINMLQRKSNDDKLELIKNLETDIDVLNDLLIEKNEGNVL